MVLLGQLMCSVYSVMRRNWVGSFSLIVYQRNKTVWNDVVLSGQLICSVYSVMGRKWVCLFSLIGCKRNQSLKIFLQKQNGTVRLKFWLRKRFQTSELNVVLWGASNVATLQWFFFFTYSTSFKWKYWIDLTMLNWMWTPVTPPVLVQVLLPALYIHLTGKQGCCGNRCGVSPSVNTHKMFRVLSGRLLEFKWLTI